MIIFVDFETRGVADLTKVGAYRYAADHLTDIFCLAVLFPEGQIRIWLSDLSKRILVAGCDLPVMDDEELMDVMSNATEIHAHNANFERCMWAYVMGRYGFDDIPLEKWRCTAAKTRYSNLPGSLDPACQAVGLPGKDKAGYSIMMKMCKPRKALKADKERDADWADRIYWHEDPEMLEKNCRYCMNDVVIEKQLDEKLLAFPDSELEVWRMDQRTNDRGVYIDMPAAVAINQVVQDSSAMMSRELRSLTVGQVNAVTERDKILEWVRSHGVDVANLQFSTIGTLLKRTDLEPTVRRVLEIRYNGSKLTSCAKYDSMIRCALEDWRVRGSLLYYGASATGRWSGRLLQLQNLPRGGKKFAQVERAIWAMENLGPEFVQGDPVAAASDCIRGVITAGPGNVLYCADYSNIEGRVQAWLSDEEWKVQAFREFDAGIGPDLYKLAFSKSFNIPVEQVDDGDQRQVGKVQELALGFGGGIKAFAEMATTYELDLEVLPELVLVRATEEQLDKADWSATRYLGMREKAGLEADMSIYAAKACDVLKQMWRASHPRIVEYWAECGAAALATIETGLPHQAGKVLFGMTRDWLRVQLPSGRLLSMFRPEIVVKKEMMENGRERVSKDITFWGVDSNTKRWMKRKTWGGDIFQSIAQAIARDVLAEAGLRTERVGYPLVFSVHDELVSEAPVGFGSQQMYDAVMAQVPSWAEGLPVSVAGWSGVRYRKG